ncbi:hypothetical protein RHGRI_003557 [Rhododendron griersonianum]|uniref:Uncharacterized protein n=1 Tax=Rhododendron griersonianum TaxID=479676 RepID=A0AAV6L6J6_9ERIC|nr:hypothetical protein RHGRI_003557 [Rhododendron griersonianum]
MDNTTLPLHLSHVQKSSSIINRSHTLLHSTALIALIYYRIASFFQTTKTRDLPTTFSCFIIFTGELILSFIWFLGQAYRFRPVTRTVFPERLPENAELPAVDVFICTADPSKEPTLEVTMLIRMLAYGIKTRCPEAYFLGEEGNNESSSGSEFMADREKEKYENFKSRVMRIRQNSIIIVNRDHTAVVELRVSAMISNSPYILVLDCDMYCNDPTSARQAMCFHLDPKISPSLGTMARNGWASGTMCVWYWLLHKERGTVCKSHKRLDVDIMELKQYFGPSIEFIKSFGRHYKPKDHQHSSSVILMKETQFLASCAYENETKWGKEASPRHILPRIH